MTALRNRLVIHHADGTENVSGLLITADEIPDALEAEVLLHQATGWSVHRYGTTLRFEKNNVVRWVWVRSRPPLEDTLA